MNGIATVSLTVTTLFVVPHIQTFYRAPPDFKYNAHMYFGKRYKFDDVKVDWHIPGEEGKLHPLDQTRFH
jgi:hypothetical protein